MNRLLGWMTWLLDYICRNLILLLLFVTKNLDVWFHSVIQEAVETNRHRMFVNLMRKNSKRPPTNPEIEQFRVLANMLKNGYSKGQVSEDAFVVSLKSQFDHDNNAPLYNWAKENEFRYSHGSNQGYDVGPLMSGIREAHRPFWFESGWSSAVFAGSFFAVLLTLLSVVLG